MAEQKTVGFVLFDKFELLDVFGPAEAYGLHELAGAFKLVMVAQQAGPVASAQGPQALADFGFDDCPHLDLIVVPGGIVTRREVDNAALISWLRERAGAAELVTSVCTGAAILARAGLLDGRRATRNKSDFAWVMSQGPRVNWVKQARWVEDGKFMTSSGVSAGIDMAVGHRAVVRSRARRAGRDRDGIRMASRRGLGSLRPGPWPRRLVLVALNHCSTGANPVKGKVLAHRARP